MPSPQLIRAADFSLTRFSFIHAADIHLDSPLRGLSRYEGVPVDQVRGATRAAFDRLIETAIDRRVDFLVIAGDLYDGDWRDMGTGLYVTAAMGRLGRAGIPVYLLAGNHDAASVITKALPPVETVHTFSTRAPQTHRIEGLDVALHGRSFADRDVYENLAAGYPAAVPGAFNIGVLHTALGGYAAHAAYAPCTPQELAAKGYDYWALGHVHDAAVLGERPHIVFPGNLQGRSIREQGPKGAVLVEVEDGVVERLTHLALDVVRWGHIAVDASNAAHVTELQDRIRVAMRRARETQAEARPLLLRVTISGQTALHGALQDVAAALRDDVRGIAAETAADLWIEKVEVRTAPPATASPLQDTDDIRALLAAADPSLATALQAEFMPFLAGLPAPEPGSLLRAAAEGDWGQIIDIAGAALQTRLGTEG
jgi:DNA repair exonuclease SbcCD nuclease subunit